MKIIDILIESAELLGLHYDVPQLNELNAENEMAIISSNENLKSLFNLVKFSIRELCTNYVPVCSSKEIQTTEKKFPIAELENYIRIKNVYRNEQPVKFKIIARNLILEEEGVYTINYATYPNITSVFDDIDFLQEFSPDAIVFGLCSYYSIAHGRFDEFETFHEKYVEKAESLKSLRIFNIPCRRWE